VKYFALNLPHVYVHVPDVACLRLVEANPRVRFEVDDVASPSRWETMIGWGTLEHLDAAGAAGHGRDGRATVYRLHLDAVRGFFRGGDPLASHPD
jgi:hypothetical protein